MGSAQGAAGGHRRIGNPHALRSDGHRVNVGYPLVMRERPVDLGPARDGQDQQPQQEQNQTTPQS